MHLYWQLKEYIQQACVIQIQKDIGVVDYNTAQNPLVNLFFFKEKRLSIAWNTPIYQKNIKELRKLEFSLGISKENSYFCRNFTNKRVIFMIIQFSVEN